MEFEYIGNKELLKLYKVGFFCSRTVSGSAVMRCYDWATKVDIEKNVIVNGFQSEMEKEVFNLLIKRHPKIILVFARSIYKKMSEELQKLLDDGSIMIVSTASTAHRIAKSSADHRNEYIAQICDKLAFGYIGKINSRRLLYEKNISKSNIINNKI